MSILTAILALGFLIFFHELGHFIAAKACGVGVLEFSIGMGPRLLSGVFHNTRYSLKLLPLGGSCAMLGEDAAGSGDFLTAEGRAEEAAAGEDPWIDYEGVRFRASELEKRSFQRKPGWQRLLICFAGVFHNLLLAFLLAVLVVFYTGFDKPYIVGTAEGAPAANAGFQQGDLLKSVSFKGKTREIRSFRELYIWLYIHSEDFTENTELRVVYLRDGEKRSAAFAPFYSAEENRYRLGISFFGGRIRAENAGELLQDAFYELRYNVRVVLDSLSMILKGRVQRNEVMGPVGTVSVIGSTVQESSRHGVFNAFLVLMELCVMLSSNLAVMNLLPIPALDGGRLLFILLEMLLRRRLRPELEEKINQAGMVLLLILMVLIFTNDIFNIISGAYRSLL